MDPTNYLPIDYFKKLAYSIDIIFEEDMPIGCYGRLSPIEDKLWLKDIEVNDRHNHLDTIMYFTMLKYNHGNADFDLTQKQVEEQCIMYGLRHPESRDIVNNCYEYARMEEWHDLLCTEDYKIFRE